MVGYGPLPGAVVADGTGVGVACGAVVGAVVGAAVGSMAGCVVGACVGMGVGLTTMLPVVQPEIAVAASNTPNIVNIANIFNRSMINSPACICLLQIY
jgi:hypothetical protein